MTQLMTWMTTLPSPVGELRLVATDAGLTGVFFLDPPTGVPSGHGGAGPLPRARSIAAPRFLQRRDSP